MGEEILKRAEVFINDVKTRMLRKWGFDEVRIPPDIRRRGVVSAEWYPWDVMEHNIGSAEGLGRVLEYVVSFAMAH